MCRNYQETNAISTPLSTPESDSIDARAAVALEREIDVALGELTADTDLTSIMARYHLGMIDANGHPTAPDVRHQVQGKRMRPTIAMLATEAVGGDLNDAAPIAAAIELLHNFTLIHDDIQDRSPNRRHRPTVWRIWGNAQAINAGDSLFAAAQLCALRTPDQTTALALMPAFNRCTIEIVQGQVMDLENEGRAEITTDRYITTIRNKTSAIVRFAAWAGALVGHADEPIRQHLAEMGLAIGLGFQIRDDMLGIWGPAEITGKDAADDIRRRKLTLPILILLERASLEERARIEALYRQSEIEPEDIPTMLDLLAKHDVEAAVAEYVEAEHEKASNALGAAFPNGLNAAGDELASLIARLGQRTF